MREFSDVYPLSTREQLLKLYKKRAKLRMIPAKTTTAANYAGKYTVLFSILIRI